MSAIEGNNKNLVVNGENLGAVHAYRQYGNPEKDGWSFLMENRVEIRIPFFLIKSFHSSGDLEITMFDVCPMWDEAAIEEGRF